MRLDTPGEIGVHCGFGAIDLVLPCCNRIEAVAELCRPICIGISSLSNGNAGSCDVDMHNPR